MTTADASAKTPKPQVLFQLPDPPERHHDEVTSYDQIHLPGNAHFLAQHLGNPETTLVAAERYVVLAPRPRRGAIRRSPDLFIAFGVDPQAYRDSNGYIISEQGKPPDFAIEVASPSTGRIDVGEKRDDYAALGITEYWRFDQDRRNITAHASPATGWWTGSISPSTSRSWRTGRCKGTVRR